MKWAISRECFGDYFSDCFSDPATVGTNTLFHDSDILRMPGDLFIAIDSSDKDSSVLPF